MRMLHRYRSRRDDPYRAYNPSSGRWGARLAIGVPIAVVVALVLDLAVAAVGSSVKEPAQVAHASLGYQSLLVPSNRAASTFQFGSPRQVQSAHRVVMSYNAGADRTKTVGSGVAAPRTRSAAGSASASYRTDEHGYRVAPAEDLAMVPYTTVLAHLEHTTKGYASANSFSSNRKVPGSWYGYPSILPVIDSTQERLKVMLAQRPDNSTSWISRDSAVLTRTHYAVVINLSQHWIYVFKRGVQLMSFPIGNGKPGTPTPTGNYFVAFHAPPTNSGYAPIMLETSAHSRVIARFDGGDDAIIAIHGPVGSDSQIGSNGAAISNGCIRMHKADLQQVRHVRNGAPVIITY